ncbi:hypothetical protein PM8797T_11656 [Gimesia maris DSM 8797]|nr:hypothetical protein PM8797T_11656 [Gimesia maris DSM 8797]
MSTGFQSENSERSEETLFSFCSPQSDSASIDLQRLKFAE